MAEIELLPTGAGRDDATVAALCELVNHVYADAESGLWLVEHTRTSLEDTAAAIAAGKVVVARDRGPIVGTLRLSQLDADTGHFGVLAVDPAARGRGLGRALVDFAEGAARARGAREMQLELLVPRDGTDPRKLELDRWYASLGYRLTERSDFARATGELAVPCDLVAYRKPLGSGG